MPPRRIGLVFEYATLNGGERSMLAVLDWLRSNDPRFEFVAIAPPVGRLTDTLRERNISVECWPASTDAAFQRSSTANEAALRQIAGSREIHLLHANSLAMGRLTGRLAATLAIPTTAHLRDIIKLSRTAVDDLNRNQKLIAVSHAAHDFHVSQGIDNARVIVIHNGVDLREFQPGSRSGTLAAELGLVPNVLANHDGVFADGSSSQCQVRFVATIGQIGLRKGQDVLADAAPAIVARVPNVHFVLVGERNSQKPESIEFERSIIERFHRAGLSPRLHRLGYRDDVATLLNEFDVLVHPANQEPFGRVLLEACAAGLPVVATHVGGTSEIVVNGVTGLLVAPHNPHELAAAVIEVLTNVDRARMFRIAARERSCREFPVSLAAERLADLWSQTLPSETEF